MMGCTLFCLQWLMVSSSRACITMMKRVGAKLSPCLTPVVYLISLCSLPILNLTTLLLYSFSMMWMMLGGMPNLVSTMVSNL